MLEDFLKTYNELTAKIDELRAQARVAADHILKEGTKSYFEKYGDIVEQIFWQQYTPWFNDGDTCEFSVHEPQIVLRADDSEDKYEEGSPFYSDISYYHESLATWREFNADPEAYKDKIAASYGGNYFSKWNTRDSYKPHYVSEQELLNRIEQYNSYPPDFVKDTTALMEMIYSMDNSIMENLFGNHVTVRITANGIETEEYSHD